MLKNFHLTPDKLLLLSFLPWHQFLSPCQCHIPQKMYQSQTLQPLCPVDYKIMIHFECLYHKDASNYVFIHNHSYSAYNYMWQNSQQRTKAKKWKRKLIGWVENNKKINGNTWFQQPQIWTWKSWDKKTLNLTGCITTNERCRNLLLSVKMRPSVDHNTNHELLIGRMKRLKAKRRNRKVDIRRLK